MMNDYQWILLQNLNDGLGLIWLALLVATTVTGLHCLTDFDRSDRTITFARFKLKWLRWLGGTLLLLGAILVALPDKEQIALLRGEEEDKGCPLSDPSADDHTSGKKRQKESHSHTMVSASV